MISNNLARTFIQGNLSNHQTNGKRHNTQQIFAGPKHFYSAGFGSTRACISDYADNFDLCK